MGTKLWLIAAAGLMAAAPAAAQTNETAAPPPDTAVNSTTVTDTHAVDANFVAMAPADTAALPPTDSNLAERAAAHEDRDRGFPWGLVGLVGLVGLLGRRRG